MLATLAVWVGSFLLMLIWGVGVYSRFSYSKISLDKAFFFGFAINAVLTGWLSLFLPINSLVYFIWLGATLVLALICRQSLSDHLRFWFKQWKATPKWASILFGVVVILFGISASAKIGLYDTGLYHAQNIMWIEQFRLVPGLGNLHGRFAFNSMAFPVETLLHVKFGADEFAQSICYPLNGILMLTLIGKLLVDVSAKIKQHKYTLAVFYAVLLLPFLVIYPGYINAPSADFSTAVLVVYVCLLFFQNDQKVISRFRLTLTLTLALITVTFKLSSLFLALIPAWLILSDRIQLRKNLFQTLFLTFLICLPFFIRNYVLSGYIVYPLPQVDLFNPDWKIPMESVIKEKNHVANWAKIARVSDNVVENMSVTEWLPHWWQAKSSPAKIILILNFSLFFTLFGFTKKQHRKKLILGLIIMLTLVFWFTNGPDPRFIHGFLFVGSALNMYLFALAIPFSITANRLFQYGTMVIVAIGLITGFLRSDFRNGHFLLPVGVKKVATKTVYSNFDYFVPAEKIACYFTPIPCAPGEKENLVMRGESLKQGFKIIDD